MSDNVRERVKKNPAYGRHQPSRPMRIVGPIQFWRGCVIYRSSSKRGLGPRENADSVHAKMMTLFTPEHIPVLRALLEIEIKLRNISSFLGLYSRSRSNSGTHPRFYGSTQDRDRDRDRTPEHILVFRALLKIEIEIKLRKTSSRSRSHQSTDEARSAPVQPRKKITWKGDIIQTKIQRNKETHIATPRPTRPRGPSWWKYGVSVISTLSRGCVVSRLWHYWFTKLLLWTLWKLMNMNVVYEYCTREVMY